MIITKEQWFLKIIQPSSGGLDKFYIIIYTFWYMMITKYWWFLKIIQPPSGGLDFYDFYRRFSIDVTTHITYHNKFDIKFIIYLSNKLKKLNYKLLILHKNKPYYTRDIIYILESPKQSSRSGCKLSVNNLGYGLLPLWIILEQSIK